jgi:hypothetical protein
MTDLSPRARAVLDATGRKTWYRNDDLAAALQAAADQLPLQPLTRDPADPFEQGLRQGQELSRAELFAIGAELKTSTTETDD